MENSRLTYAEAVAHLDWLRDVDATYVVEMETALGRAQAYTHAALADSLAIAPGQRIPRRIFQTRIFNAIKEPS